MFGLKGHMGKYDQLDMEDILNNPDDSPNMPRETVHAQLAKVYCLWINEICAEFNFVNMLKVDVNCVT